MSTPNTTRQHAAGQPRSRLRDSVRGSAAVNVFVRRADAGRLLSERVLYELESAGPEHMPDPLSAAVRAALFSALDEADVDRDAYPQWFCTNAFHAFSRLALGIPADSLSGAECERILWREYAAYVATRDYWTTLCGFAELQLPASWQGLRRRLEAEDLVSTAIQDILKGSLRWTGGKVTLQAFLRGVIRNRARRLVRRSRKSVVLSDGLPPAAPPAGDAFERAARAMVGRDVGEALAALTPAERATVIACDLEGWSAAALARKQGDSPAAIRQRLSRGRRRLRELLAKYGQ
jgi:RNA polymerase sigma factor (sigma-70 family)